MRKFICSVCCAWIGVVYGTNYYLSPKYNYRDEDHCQPLTNGVYWTTERDGTGDVASSGALPADSSHHFFLAVGSELDTNNTVVVDGTSGLTNDCYRLHIGDRSVTPPAPGAIVHCFEETKKTLRLSSKYVYLEKGCLIYGTPYTTTTASGSYWYIQSPMSDPFQIAFAASGFTATCSSIIKAAADTMLLVGGDNFHCADSSNLTSDTLYLSGTLTEFYGTLMVTNAATKVQSATARNVTLRLRTTANCPGTIRMMANTGLSLYSTNAVLTVCNLELGNNVLLTYPINLAGQGRFAATINVTNSFTLAAGGKVGINLTATGLQAATYDLPLITAPADSTFTAEDFQLLPRERAFCSLSIDTTTTPGKRKLMCHYVFAPSDTVFAKKSDSTSYKNNSATYYASIITNELAWSDGASVGPGKDYLLRSYGSTIYALRTPQASWSDGQGNTGADFTFPGKSLTVGGESWLMPIGVRTTFNDLTLLDGAILATPSISAKTYEINGNITIPSGSVSIRPYSSKTYKLSANFMGNGQLSFDGWLNSKASGTNILNGSNAAFAGTMRISTLSTNESYTYCQNLIADCGERFGVALPSYNPEALLLEKYGTLRIKGPTTLATNRGVTVSGHGCIQVAAGAAFAADGLTLDGELKLEGTARFGTCSSQAGSALVFTGGSLTVGSESALAGAALSLSKAVTFVFTTPTPKPHGRGLDLSTCSISKAAGTTLAFAAAVADITVTGDTVTNAFLTVPQSQVADFRSCVGTVKTREAPAGYVMADLVETANADGTVTFKDVWVTRGVRILLY